MVRGMLFCSLEDSSAMGCYLYQRVFSHEVTAAILVSQNNETAAILGVPSQCFGSCNNSFLMQTLRFLLFQYICIDAGHVSEDPLYCCGIHRNASRRVDYEPLFW